jgi:aspartate/methionine/tyrosine aminotransferase
MREAWKPYAAYMEWAKLHSEAPWNLATSGLLGLPMSELPARLEDLEINSASPYGHEPLLAALAEHLQVEPASVVLAAGTSMANHLALAGLVEHGDEVLLESPGYPLIAAAARYLGAEVVTYERRPEEGFRLDPQAVARRLSPRTRVIVVTNLHNPSSVRTDEAVLREVGVLAREAGARVLVDEVYLEAVFAPRPPSAVHLGPEFVVTSSLTKAYGLSGLRCGWILAEPDLARSLWRLNDVFAASAAHPAERLSLVALQHLGPIRDRASRILETNRPVLQRFLDGRDDLETVRSSWGTTSFPRLKSGRVDELCSGLRDRYQTSVVPGHFFGAPDHFRIGVGGEPEMTAEGLRRLGGALDEMKGSG